MATHCGQALRGRERDRGLSLLVDRRHVPATLRDEGCPTPRPRQRKGMPQLVRQGQGLVEAGPRLLRVPQQPEGPGGIGAAGHPRILAKTERRRTALVGRVVGDACLQVLAGCRQGAEAEPRHPKGIVRDDRERRVVGALRQAQQRLPDLTRRVVLWPCHIIPPQP